MALLRGDPANAHCRSQADYGGLAATMFSLQRRGLIDWKSGKLTKLGRQIATRIARNLPVELPKDPHS